MIGVYLHLSLSYKLTLANGDKVAANSISGSLSMVFFLSLMPNKPPRNQLKILGFCIHTKITKFEAALIPHSNISLLSQSTLVNQVLRF